MGLVLLLTYMPGYVDKSNFGVPGEGGLTDG